mmetsp:Transcript_10512/g.34728  ORF Transcript_10512/g.34728 Transcript_10512/m.34728 type:complete len:99 (-) Transcript_10512:1350-1646(-)
MFDVLSSLRLFYNRKLSREMARDLGRRAMEPSRRTSNASKVAGFALYDNLLLRLLTNKEHGDVFRRNDQYQTIQWTTVDVSDAFDDEIRGAIAKNKGV